MHCYDIDIKDFIVKIFLGYLKFYMIQEKYALNFKATVFEAVIQQMFVLGQYVKWYFFGFWTKNILL